MKWIAIVLSRLGVYLFSRVLKEGHDRRFDKVRGNPKLFLVYWTLQGNNMADYFALLYFSPAQLLILFPTRCLGDDNDAPHTDDDDGKESTPPQHSRFFGLGPMGCGFHHGSCGWLPKESIPRKSGQQRKIYQHRPLECVPPSQLFWRDPSLVWSFCQRLVEFHGLVVSATHAPLSVNSIMSNDSSITGNTWRFWVPPSLDFS